MTLTEYKQLHAQLEAQYLETLKRAAAVITPKTLANLRAGFSDGLTAMWSELLLRKLVGIVLSCDVCSGAHVDPVGYPCSRGVPGEDVKLTEGGICRCAHHRGA